MMRGQMLGLVLGYTGTAAGATCGNCRHVRLRIGTDGTAPPRDCALAAAYAALGWSGSAITAHLLAYDADGHPFEADALDVIRDGVFVSDSCAYWEATDGA